jgi:hypothetical protein
LSVTSLRRVSVTPYKVRQRRGAVHSKEALQCLCADLPRHEGEPSLRAWTHPSVSPKHPGHHHHSRKEDSGEGVSSSAATGDSEGLPSSWRNAKSPPVPLSYVKSSILSSLSPECGDAESIGKFNCRGGSIEVHIGVKRAVEKGQTDQWDPAQ